MDETSLIEAYTDVSLPSLPLWAVTFALLVALPAAALAGHRVGGARIARARPSEREVLARSGETTVGAILALLGLLVAFLFGNSLGWAEDGKQAVLQEANALGTAYLRADLLPGPGRDALKETLLAYAETRMPDRADIATVGGAQAFLAETLEAQGRLWPATIEATAAPVPAATQSFVAGAVNDVIDAHAARMATLNRPAAEITGLMVVAAALTGLFLVGNRSGLQGRPLTWRTFIFAGFLWVVMSSIVDLQRPLEGVIRADYGLLEATIADMRRSGAEPG
ncbi:MAG: hypothetical protein V2I65_01420 [Paracoccaceae bacterium]|jgi:hypothetical protein|nr:hypothetical protein [Paracoccaceae bacterium]